MSNQELSDITNRINLENNYLSAIERHKILTPKKKSLGEKFVKTIAKSVIAPAAIAVGRDWFEKELRKATGTEKQQNKKK